MELKAISLTTIYIILYMSVSLAHDDAIWKEKYKIKELANLQEDIWDIAVSPHTGNIYLAYGKSYMYVIRNESSSKINIQANIRAVAVDTSSKFVYIGCDEGIKKYDENTGSITKVSGVKTSITALFVSKNNSKIYGITSPTHKVYLYENMFTDKFNLNITISNQIWYCRFVVDFKGNIFYTTRENGSFVTKILFNGEHSPIVYDAGPFHSLAVDDLGRVYGVPFVENNLYRLKEDGSKPNMVATLYFTPRIMSFDKINDPVFATQDNRLMNFKFPTNAEIAKCI